MTAPFSRRLDCGQIAALVPVDTKSLLRLRMEEAIVGISHLTVLRVNRH